MGFRLAPARAPTVAGEAMVASSSTLATLSALDTLRSGGNAVDAALCAAAMLCVTEPHATGIGGDLFALVRTADGDVFALDAAGPAPRDAPAEAPAESGPRSVTVPGAVAGWSALSSRFGRLGIDRCIAPAVDAANRGVVAGSDTAHHWWRSPNAPAAFGPPPPFGGRYSLPELGATLATVATNGHEALYLGPVAEAIAGASWLELEDLAGYEPRWVEPLTHTHGGITVHELPPPTQGVAALEALALLGDDEPTLRRQVHAVSLALEDALNSVRDGADVTGLISSDHVEARRRESARRSAGPGGGTVYLCAVDGERNAVSLIQSLYESFGSGVVAGSTGIVLHNRGACFAVGGRVVPGRRPYHTLIPGMLLRGDDLVGPFGVMGGFIQAQAHFQFVVELLRNGLDPQAALDHGRFRIDGDVVALEEPLWEHATEVAALGYRINRAADRAEFGGGQSIVCRDGTLLGGSDARKDGCALGF
jgi:gamma-glutamyltranspeptidase / glutathione hydrolase